MKPDQKNKFLSKPIEWAPVQFTSCACTWRHMTWHYPLIDFCFYSLEIHWPFDDLKVPLKCHYLVVGMISIEGRSALRGGSGVGNAVHNVGGGSLTRLRFSVIATSFQHHYSPSILRVKMPSFKLRPCTSHSLDILSTLRIPPPHTPTRYHNIPSFGKSLRATGIKNTLIRSSTRIFSRI